MAWTAVQIVGIVNSDMGLLCRLYVVELGTLFWLRFFFGRWPICRSRDWVVIYVHRRTKLEGQTSILGAFLQSSLVDYDWRGLLHIPHLITHHLLCKPFETVRSICIILLTFFI